MKKILLLPLFLFSCSFYLMAQKDSTGKKIPLHKISFLEAFKKDKPGEFYPRKATYRSAVLPGWGQAYNKKYWKLPLVWGALGTTVFVFIHNIKQYNEARTAYILAIDTIPGNDYLIKEPYYSVRSQPEVIRSFRNQVRQNVDYTVLFFLAFWGLNVVDATVDGQLKNFDVSDNLSIHIQPGHSRMANTDGISIVLNIK